MYKQLAVWGRKVRLKIDMDCIEGEVVTPVQNETLSEFLSDKNRLDKVLLKVEQYCLSERELKTEKSIENIFKYVSPKTIFVPRDDKKKTVAILCDYYFDEEHGIAIVFEDGKYKGIVEQDDVI